MAIENSSMSIKGSKNTPQRAKENDNTVLFDINEWDRDDHSAINQSGDFGGNNDMTILSER